MMAAGGMSFHSLTINDYVCNYRIGIHKFLAYRSNFFLKLRRIGQSYIKTVHRCFHFGVKRAFLRLTSFIF